MQPLRTRMSRPRRQPRSKLLKKEFFNIEQHRSAKMAINVKSTGSLSANGVKLLVYGQAGAGKTSV
jgi:ABC-type uncharacterized transport system fused permease/ATPase subunit